MILTIPYLIGGPMHGRPLPEKIAEGHDLLGMEQPPTYSADHGPTVSWIEYRRVSISPSADWKVVGWIDSAAASAYPGGRGPERLIEELVKLAASALPTPGEGVILFGLQADLVLRGERGAITMPLPFLEDGYGHGTQLDLAAISEAIGKAQRESPTPL